MRTAFDGMLGELCRIVDSMKPGECFKVSRFDLREIPTFWHNGAQFTPEDRVLENVVGSAYTHSYDVDPMSGDVTFRRHADDGKRRYQSPDRRHASGYTEGE